MDKNFVSIIRTLNRINDNRLKEIDNAVEVLWKETDYIEDYSIIPNDGYLPFKNGDRWGGNIDMHAWFKVNLDLSMYQGETIRIIAHTDKFGEDVWDAVNPQLIVYIDDRIVQGMDVKHTYCDIKGGKKYKINFYAYSGNECSERLTFYFKIYKVNKNIEKLYYDINTAIETLKISDDNSFEYAEASELLKDITEKIKFEDAQKFALSVLEASNEMDKFFIRFRSVGPSRILNIGSTHIDIGWLWKIRQTEEKVIRSFSTVINLMKKYHKYNFMSSQAFLYDMVKRRDKDLYNSIAERVKEGRFETEGAMWVESDCNMPAGECIIRQILYGKEFFKKEFNNQSHIAWLVDSFGYSAALPQIFVKSGIDFFITSKLNWNDTNMFPYDLFMWKGIDGSEIPTYFLTSRDYDKDDRHCQFTVYNAYVNPSFQKGTWERFRDKSVTNKIPLMFGYGDGGGGPSDEQLQMLKRLEYGSFDMPSSKMSTLSEFVSETLENIAEKHNISTYKDELYLEFHRGVYTTLSRIKKVNRKIEFGLHNSEICSSINEVLFDNKYDSEEFKCKWLKFLTTQFHDILPGSAIKEVYEEVDAIYKEVNNFITEKEHALLNNFIDDTNADKDYFIVFNLNGVFYNGCFLYNNKYYKVKNVYPNGYTYILKKDALVVDNKAKIDERCIYNDKICVKFDKNYLLISIFDKVGDREILKDKQKANEIRVYEDNPPRYDAWELENYYYSNFEVIDNIFGVEKINDGYNVGYRVERKYLQSTIIEEITINSESSAINFKTKVDWKESHKLLKTVFPIDVNTDKAICNIQFGNIERSTLNNTSQEKAKYEVCCHKYVDLSESNYGVALINDCKYGYGIKNNDLSLSLLRSPEYPYKKSDYGEHEFSYLLYVHHCNFYDSDVYNKSLFYNNAIKICETSSQKKTINNSYSLAYSNADNIVIETIKKSQDNNGYIVRLFENSNKYTKCAIKFGIKIRNVWISDLLENKLFCINVNIDMINLIVKPYEIISLYLEIEK